jgi:hypothetical protein
MFGVVLLGAQEPASPRFVVCTKDGALPAAAVQRLDAGWALERAGDKTAIAGADWISMQQEGRPRPAPPTQRLVVLGNGDRLPLNASEPVRLQDGRLQFTPAEPVRPQSGTALSLFRPYVGVLLLAVPAGVDDVELFLARLHREPRENDVVLLRNGDRIEGPVNRLSETDGCESVVDEQTVRTPMSRIAGIAFATTSLARPRPRKLHALAVLAGGARVQFASLRRDAALKQWSGRTTSGVDVAFPEPALIALDLMQGRALYLTEVPPLGYKYTPYLGAQWPLGVDTGLDGKPLRVGEDHYDKGLSLHAPSRITYWLDGHFTWFESTVGLDPAAGTRGRARIALIVDGKRYPLADGKELSADDPPLPVRLDVRGARTLVLVVELGSLGDVQARVNWGGVRLLRNRIP